MNKILLETINLKKTYEHINGNIILFKNINLKIKRGDLIALVGPSGSGKSSLLHLLALLDEPTSGKILINNKDTKNLSENKKDEIRRDNISIIFQDNNLLTDFTAIENVMMPLVIKGVSNKNTLEKAEKILKEVKILNRSNHFPNELSGGEQQRVAIARALIAETNFILADEPTGNLDSAAGERILNLLLDMARKRNTSVLLATHDSTVAAKCDRTIHVSDGIITD